MHNPSKVVKVDQVCMSLLSSHQHYVITHLLIAVVWCVCAVYIIIVIVMVVAEQMGGQRNTAVQANC